MAIDVKTAKPFYYETFDNFLSKSDFEHLVHAYNKLAFKEIKSDLFNFSISNELNKDKRFTVLTDKLDAIFKEKITVPDTFYTFSASYYKKDNFLLCHDDMVDERLYAFVFYIEDFDSGKLLIYENDCVTLHEAIDVRANRLIIFKVGGTSYHEVQRCTIDGRKAISGWINNKDVKNVPCALTTNFTIHSNVVYFELDLELVESYFFCLPFDGLKYQTECGDRKITGPFIDRRVYELTTDTIYAPNLEGYDLVHTEDLLFEPDCYILTNDKINLIDGDLLDVFVFDCEEDIPDFIKYSNGKEIVMKVEANDERMFIGKRNGCKLYIDRVEKPVRIQHFVYLKRQ